MASAVRQNFHADSEAAINKQINLDLQSSYAYQAISFYFDREEVALKGVHGFFKDLSDEKREDAEKLKKYQNQRGGRVVLQDIQKPGMESWGNSQDAMEAALAMAKRVNQSIIDLHDISDKHEDAALSDFLEGEFMAKNVEKIKTISDHMTNLKRNKPGLGEYLYSKHTLESD